MDKTDVYHIIVVTGDPDRPNQHAIVFSEPTEGKVYKQGHVFVFPGGAEMLGTDDNHEIPQKELEPGDDQLAFDPATVQDYFNKYGVTWHWAK